MERRVKVAWAGGILLMGIVAALLFRRDPPPPTPPVQGVSNDLILKRVNPSPGAGQDGLGSGRSTAGDAQEPGRWATVLTPLGSSQPPPDLPKSYPGVPPSANSRWGLSMGQVLPETAPSPPRLQVHKVVDGDTLADLADRYLGSKERAAAIFAANRDVLGSPQVLPIGVELKIPPAESLPPLTLAPPAPSVPGRLPLVPID